MIKAVVSERKCDGDYPKIMSCEDGDIVLFSEPGVGTVIYGGFFDVGYHSSSWIMGAFSHFAGLITLSNED